MPYALLNRFILVFIGLFVVVDPFAAVPVIIGLTKDDDDAEIRRVARRASLFGAGILLFFSLAGTSVFRFLQIDLNAFRAAGGLLLLITALRMLAPRRKPRPDDDAGAERDDISVVPFATPLLSGPGAITSVVVFATDHGDDPAAHYLVLTAAVLAVFLAAYAVLRSAIAIKRALGPTGIMLVQQLMGLLLAALSLQFIVQGTVALVKSLP